MKRFAIIVLLLAAIACTEEQGHEWKAVQDLQPPRNTPGGTLKITGVLKYDGNTTSPSLLPREPQGINPKILMLEVINPTKGKTELNYTYTHTMMTEDQFTSVEIYSKGEKIADLKIEKVH